MPKRPNFIIFITDQHRADWLGCYGHKVVKTPHIDAIAAKGVRFENFHVASPVCMPNRASLLTGRYPSVHGLRYNGCVLPRRANTFVDVLAAGGYHTAAIGKSHLQPTVNQPPKRPPNELHGPIADAWKPDGDSYEQEQRTSFGGPGRSDFDTPYYGYQHVDMVTGHGDRCGGHYGEWFRDRAGDDYQALHEDANELPHDYTCPQAFRTPVPEDLYPTAYIRDRAIDYLQDRKESDQPFFLFVSFPDPHHPFNPPGKYWNMYKPDDFELHLPYEAHRNPTPPMRWLRDNWLSGGGQLTPQTATMARPEELRQAMALTAGMITMVDDAIGEVVSCLEDCGLDGETVVAFTSDHGDYLGDFGMLLKGALPFRSITHVPFIWSDPEMAERGSTPALGSTLDIGPTILARAGIDPYFGMQGRSLLAAMNGGAGPRQRLMIEYNDNGTRMGFAAPARVRALVTQSHRLTLYLDQDWGELYDLKADPNETRNLWDDPQHATTRAELCLALGHELTRAMDESPQSKHIA